MARLEGRPTELARTSLLVVPIAPDLKATPDAYQVILFENDVAIFDKIYTVYEWQLGHSHMFRIASAFEQAPKLLDIKIDIYLGQLTANYSDFTESAVLREDINWMEAILWGRTLRGEPHIFVEVYLQTEPEGPDTPLIPFVCKRFSCQPEAVENFGQVLKRECEATRARRIELGIPAEDD